MFETLFQDAEFSIGDLKLRGSAIRITPPSHRITDEFCIQGNYSFELFNNSLELFNKIYDKIHNSIIQGDDKMHVYSFVNNLKLVEHDDSEKIGFARLDTYIQDPQWDDEIEETLNYYRTVFDITEFLGDKSTSLRMTGICDHLGLSNDERRLKIREGLSAVRGVFDIKLPQEVRA